MATFCLNQQFVDKFKRGLSSGDINPEKLNGMGSAERREYLSEFVGKENAAEVNTLFEKKLLLKNTERGIVNWANDVLGNNTEKKDSILQKVREEADRKNSRLFNPKEGESFLGELAQDYVNTKYKIDPSPEEVKTIFDLTNEVSEARKGIDEKTSTFDTPEEKEKFGVSQALLKRYVGDLKMEAKKTTVKNFWKNPVKTIDETLGFSKSVTTALDNSFFGKQGLKVLIDSPGIWAKGFAKSWVDITKVATSKAEGTLVEKVLNNKVGDAVTLAIDADMESRPNAIKGKYKKYGIDILTKEEAFPTSLPEKIPLLGRLFKASEVAYEGGARRLRADLADKFIAMREGQGVDLDADGAKHGKALGDFVNTLTGRGSLGNFEGASKEINVALFSPKYMKSNYDFLTANMSNSKADAFTRKRSAMNLAKGVLGAAAVMSVANQLWPGSAETDPRSADFGKIKIGNTRFDITGGMASVVTLLSREITQKSKSTTTGEVKELGTGVGQTSGLDAFLDFFVNKTSPAASVVVDLLKQEDRNGNKPTVAGELGNLGVPLSIKNFSELNDDPNAANAFIGAILDGLGVSTNTYGGSKADLQKSFDSENVPENVVKEFDRLKGKGYSVSLTEPDTKFDRIRELKGDAAYEAAFDDYHQLLGEKISAEITSSSYKSLTIDKKSAILSKIHDSVVDKVAKDHGYKEATKAKVSDK